MSFFRKIGNFFKSWQFIGGVVFLIVAWLVIIFGGRSYFDVYTHHGENIQVPNLLGNNAQDIPALIGDRPLKYEVLDSIYNPDLPSGTVVYQNPMPSDSTGTMVKQDRVIRVRVSKESRLVNMPIVTSRSERFAEGLLRSKGLRIKVNYVPSSEDQGSVISQKYKGKDVAPGQQVPINSLVELTVGKRTMGDLMQVPNLVGLTIKEANDRLVGSSLRAFLSCMDCANESDSLNFKVIRQSPVAGDSSMIPEGSSITIFGAREYNEPIE